MYVLVSLVLYLVIYARRSFFSVFVRSLVRYLVGYVFRFVYIVVWWSFS